MYSRIELAREAGLAEAPPRGTAATPTPPTTTTARAAAEASPSREVGHFWRIADRYYGDTALIRGMQAAGYPAEHAGFGFFDIVLPKGKISFNRAQDERLFEEQIGRLHTLDVRGDVDLPAMLVELEAAGHAAAGGEWETMPTRSRARAEREMRRSSRLRADVDRGGSSGRNERCAAARGSALIWNEEAHGR